MDIPFVFCFEKVCFPLLFLHFFECVHVLIFLSLYSTLFFIILIFAFASPLFFQQKLQSQLEATNGALKDKLKEVRMVFFVVLHFPSCCSMRSGSIPLFPVYVVW